MIFNTAHLRTASGSYNFAVDGGGAVLPTVIPLGFFFPFNSVVWWGAARVLTTLVSGGAATISVGVTDTPDRFISSAAVALWTAGSMVTGNDLALSPALITQGATGQPQELVMRIEVATLTAGRFIYSFTYIEYPQTAI